MNKTDTKTRVKINQKIKANRDRMKLKQEVQTEGNKMSPLHTETEVGGGIIMKNEAPVKHELGVN